MLASAINLGAATYLCLTFMAPAFQKIVNWENSTVSLSIAWGKYGHLLKIGFPALVALELTLGIIVGVRLEGKATSIAITLVLTLFTAYRARMIVLERPCLCSGFDTRSSSESMIGTIVGMVLLQILCLLYAWTWTPTASSMPLILVVSTCAGAMVIKGVFRNKAVPDLPAIGLDGEVATRLDRPV